MAGHLLQEGVPWLARPAQLYDLAVDPGEEQDLFERRPELAAALSAELETLTGRATPSKAVTGMLAGVRPRTGASALPATHSQRPRAVRREFVVQALTSTELFPPARRASGWVSDQLDDR